MSMEIDWNLYSSGKKRMSLWVVLSNQFKTCIAKIRRVLLMETRAPLTRLLKERIRSDKCVSARRIEDPGWK